VLIFLWFGWMKFLPFEAEGVAGIVRNHFLMSVPYDILGTTRFSGLIGSTEIAIGVLLALGQWKPWASALGGTLGAVTFLFTLSFLSSVGPLAPEGYSFPALGSSGQFLIKDVVLLAGCVLIARDGWKLWHGDGVRMSDG
ncbi:MAG: DUF417 family protein, partial [Novosphingobium sp.]